MNLGRRLLPILCYLASATTLAAETRSFDFEMWGGFEIDLPEGWSANLQGSEAEGGPAIHILPPPGAPLELLLTPFPFPGDAEELKTAVRNAVEQAAEGLKPNAVEDQLAIREMNGPGCQALYFSATDRTVEVPSASDFKYVDQGAAAVGPWMMTFTVFTNAGDAPERSRALEVVRSSRHLPPGPPWRTSDGSYALALPGHEWRLVLDLPGYDIEPVELLSGSLGVKLGGSNEETGMIITVFLEPAQEGWTALDYRKDTWKRLRKEMPLEREDVRLYERDEMALLEFRVPAVEGVPLNQKSLNAFLVRDGVWIDVHLSKVSFRPEDQPLFEQVVASVRFEP